MNKTSVVIYRVKTFYVHFCNIHLFIFTGLRFQQAANPAAFFSPLRHGKRQMVLHNKVPEVCQILTQSSQGAK